jgi:hypothetical protein
MFLALAVLLGALAILSDDTNITLVALVPFAASVLVDFRTRFLDRRDNRISTLWDELQRPFRGSGPHRSS